MGAFGGIISWKGLSADALPAVQSALNTVAVESDSTRSQFLSGASFAFGSRCLVARSSGSILSRPAADLDSLTIVADVRLDNRPALIQALRPTTSDRQGPSDAQLVLAAYQEWGNNCAAKLLGDFSFVIWDSAQQEVYCARDPVGARPFYYCVTEQGFCFADDIAALLTLPGVSDEMQEDYVAAHLLDENFEHPELTFFRSIRRLPPARFLKVRQEVVRLVRYWDPADAPRIALSSDAEYAEAFLDLLKDAISVRLREVSSVGAHVTGGLDSSSIVALAARQLHGQGKALSGYCWEPPPEPDAHDERSLIQAIAAQESVPVRYQTLTAADLVAVLRRDLLREPTVDTLLHEQIVQRQATSEGVDVILSGWGGDELIAFNGRGYLPQLLLEGRWRRLYEIGCHRSSHPWLHLLGHAALPLAPGWLQDRVLAQWQRKTGVSLATPDFLMADRVPALRRAATPLLKRRRRPIGIRPTQLHLLERGHLVRRIESWAASGARWNLEYRYPLLDRRLIEFALGIPEDQFVRGPWTRYLMRYALEGIVPSEIQWNRDKSDPARARALRQVTPAAYAQAGACLAASEVAQFGSRYVDVAKLLERLRTGVPAAGPESNRVWHLLQFLDF